MELTERRLQICEFIAQFTAENRYAPTIREIGRAVGIASTAAVQYQILALERVGALSRKAGYSRTIVLSPQFLALGSKRSTRTGSSLRGMTQYAE